MKTSLNNIDEIFVFKGLWDVESKCGLKIIEKGDKYVLIVSELYLDNPGTSITQASTILPKQICEHFEIPFDKIIYIEHNPDMNSKLSFYDEEFFLVTYNIINNEFTNPIYKQLINKEIKNYILNDEK